MKITRLFVLLILVFAFQNVFAQSTQAEGAEQQRTERLVGLGKVWGAVKYFHPFLAYRAIDWDKALIETIPKVNSAKNSQEYQLAINSMLSVLGDKNTRAEIKLAAPEISKKDAGEFIRLENGLLFIHIEQGAKIREQDEDKYGEILEKNMALLTKAKAIIVDIRSTGEYNEAVSYNFEDFLHQILTQILDADVQLGTYRYRMHNGYAPQDGSPNNGYYSALLNTATETLSGQSKSKTLPIVFLINEQTAVASKILSGLQAAKKGVVVQETTVSGSREAGVKTLEIKLSEGISVKVRSAELINPDGSVGFKPDQIISGSDGEAATIKQALRILHGGGLVRTRKQNAPSNSKQVAEIDKPYAEMEFPNSEYRLLALFRFWNVINYFYPYKNLIGEPWENILPRYIPKFEKAGDAFEYQTTAREMVAEIHDSHGFIRGTKKFDEKIGNFIPPLKLNYIEDRTVIEKVLDDKMQIKRGDVLLAIDGEPVENRRRYFEKTICCFITSGTAVENKS